MARYNGTANDDTINGDQDGAGSNDIINGLGGDDTLRGLGGRDTLNGGSGDDILYGGTGSDKLNGDDGNDQIVADGDDTIEGGDGDDIVYYSGVVLAGTAAGGLGSKDALAFQDALFDGQSGSATFSGFERFTNTTQSLSGSAKADVVDLSSITATTNLNGLAAELTIHGGGGDDIISGGSERDIIYGDTGGDTLNGGDGNDAIFADGTDTIDGGDGDDIVYYSEVVLAGSAVGGTGSKDALNFDDALFDGQSGTVTFGGFERFANTTQSLTGSAMADVVDLSSITATTNLNGLAAELTIHGGGGNDTITGGSEQDNIYGDTGADTLNGGDGNDAIVADGADTIDGGDGDDIVYYSGIVLAGSAAGGTGSKDALNFDDALFDGLSGTVTFTGFERFANTTQSLDGSAKADVVDLSSITATTNLNGLAAELTIHGGGGNDTITGGSERDEIYGDSGADTLNGGDGNDAIVADGADTIDGGDGDDIVYYSEVVLAGSAVGGTGSKDALNFDDALFDGQSGTVTFGGFERFTNTTQSLDGSARADVVDLSSITATTNLNGLAAELTIHGGGGNDTITGGSEQDIIYGDTGADTLNGGDGDDAIVADGADTIDGGDGDDIVYYSEVVLAGSAAGGTGSKDALNFDGALFGGQSGTVTFTGFERFTNTTQSLDGSARADVVDLSSITATTNLNGLAAELAIRGGGGDDVITGGSERDTISGDSGNDDLSGGKGQDTIVGDGGRDVFRFGADDTGATTQTADTIDDFSHAQHDHIDLSAIDAKDGTAAHDRFRFIGAAEFTGKAGQLRYVFSSGDTYVAADTDGDKSADLVIKLEGTITLVASDFTLGGGAFAISGDASSTPELVAETSLIGGHDFVGGGIHAFAIAHTMLV